jgi:spermidine synthase
MTAMWSLQAKKVAMVPWVQLDTARIPAEGGELRLMQRGSEFSIMLGANELMNSRVSGSESALARLGCAGLKDRGHPRVLIGGLGMGFTLRAALAELPETAAVVVAELVPSVVAWAQGPLAPIFGSSLSDSRVRIEEIDVSRIISTARAAYDAILLDVDNGPNGLTRSSNSWLYHAAGLKAAWSALRPSGVLAVWSAHPDAYFTDRLERTGFVVALQRVRANGTRGARHTIWLARRSQS